MFPEGDLLHLYLLILNILLEGLLDLGSDKLGRGQRLCLLGPLDLSRQGNGEEAASRRCRKEALTANRMSPVEMIQLTGSCILATPRSAEFWMGLTDMPAEYFR
jgi:hypothetical protein